MMLKLAFLAWASTASADVVTTYQFSAQYPSAVMHEDNPVFAPLRESPRVMSAALAASYAGAGWAIYRYVKPQHPKLAIVGLIGASLAQGYVASRNVHNMRELDRR